MLVDDGIAYFAAGLFPVEGVYLYAVRAEDGQLVWCNDAWGRKARGLLSPQGYLLASKKRLFAPQGRGLPVAFDRNEGRFLLQVGSATQIGGTYALLVGDCLFAGTEKLSAYMEKPGAKFAQFAFFAGRQLIVTRDFSYMMTDREMLALDRTTYPKASLLRGAVVSKRYRLVNEVVLPKRNVQKFTAAVKQHEQTLNTLDQQIAELAKNGETRAKQLAALKTQRAAVAKKLEADAKSLATTKAEVARLEQEMNSVEEQRKKAEADMAASVKWRCPAECPEALILAGDVLFAGGKDKVIAINTPTGKRLWTGKVEGTAKGLAVAAGHLFVSTDTGAIYCFGPACGSSSHAGRFRARGAGPISMPTRATPPAATTNS